MTHSLRILAPKSLLEKFHHTHSGGKMELRIVMEALIRLYIHDGINTEKFTGMVRIDEYEAITVLFPSNE